LARVAASRGEQQAVDDYLAEAVRLAEDLDDHQGLVITLLTLAHTGDARGDKHRVAALLLQALTIAHELATVWD
jgi:hypothetical protein